MSAVRSRKKRLFKILAVGCLVIVIVALALPLWLPRAQLADGKVQFGSNEVRVAAAQWHRGKLTASAESSKPRETFVLNGDFSGTPPYLLSIDTKSSGLTGRLRLSRVTNQWRTAD